MPTFSMPKNINFSADVFISKPHDIILGFLKATVKKGRLVCVYLIEEHWLRSGISVKELSCLDLERLSRLSSRTGNVFFVIESPVLWVEDFLINMGYICQEDEIESHLHEGHPLLEGLLAKYNAMNFVVLCFSHDAEFVYVYS